MSQNFHNLAQEFQFGPSDGPMLFSSRMSSVIYILLTDFLVIVFLSDFLQITFSYGIKPGRQNVVNIHGFDTEKDPTR